MVQIMLFCYRIKQELTHIEIFQWKEIIPD